MPTMVRSPSCRVAAAAVANGLVGADHVQHDVGTPAVGEVPQLLDEVGSRLENDVGARLLGQLSGLRAGVRLRPPVRQ